MGLPIVAADAGGMVVTVMGASGAGGVVAVNVAVVVVSIGAAGVGASAVGVTSVRGETGKVVTGEGSSSTLQAMSVRADAKATRIKVKIRIVDSHSTLDSRSAMDFIQGRRSGRTQRRKGSERGGVLSRYWRLCVRWDCIWRMLVCG